MSAEPLYHRKGEHYVPTGLTRGPWDERHQHGGAPAALIAGALESHEGADAMALTRVNFEFLRPVPLEPLALAVAVDSGGRRVQRLRASLHMGKTEICRATGLRIRRSDALSEQAGAPESAPRLPAADEIADADVSSFPAGFARDAMELRFLEGRFHEPGPATVWFRLRAPVVDDHPATSLQSAVAAADFGNGVSAMLDWKDSLFINTDLTVALEREPEGEWVCLDASTHLGPRGAAVSESVLHDRAGRIGRALQCLLIDRRDAERF
ncbi:MAG: thioesterase family protein [Solirubrobacteraceae bacterium]